MKELKLIIPEKELHQKKKQKQEFKFIGSTRAIRGLKLYEFDFNKMEVKEAYIKKTVSLNVETNLPDEKKTVFHNKNVYYYQALNLRTAIKKANKIVFEKSGIVDYFKIEKGVVLRKVVK